MDTVSGAALPPRRVSSLSTPHTGPSPQLHRSHSQGHRSVYSNSSVALSEIVLPPIRLTPIEGPNSSRGLHHAQVSTSIDSSHLHPSVRQNDRHGMRLPGTLHVNNHISSPRHPPPTAHLGLEEMETDDADTTIHPGRPSSSASFASSSNLSHGGSADVPSTPAGLLIPLTSATSQRKTRRSRGCSSSHAPARSLTSIQPRRSQANAEWRQNSRQGSEGGYDSGKEERSDDGSTGPGSSNTHGDAEPGRLSAFGSGRGHGRSVSRYQGQDGLHNDDIDQEQYQLYAEPTSPASLATSANLPPTTGSFRAAPKPTHDTLHTSNPWHTAIPTSFPAPVALTASSSTVANAMQIITTATPPLSLTDLPNFPAEQKPPFTYPVLIRLAIMGSPQRRLLLSQIYAAIEDKFPWYKENASKAWKASIRHCLSLNKEFVRIQRAADDTTHGGGGWWSVDDGATGVKRPRKRRNQIPSADTTAQDETQVSPLSYFTFQEHPSLCSYPQATPRPHLGASSERRYRASSYAGPTATRANPYPQHDRNYHSPVLSRKVGSPVPKSFSPLSSVDRGHPQSSALLGNQNPPLPRSSLQLPPLQLPVSVRSRPNPMRISSLVHAGQTSEPAAPTTSK